MDLTGVESAVRTELDAKFEARERALRGSRRIIQSSSKAIRSLHRGERSEADSLIAEARAVIAEIESPLLDHTDIYHAGFFSDAVKEYAEAELTAALLAGERLPLPADLGIGSVPYLNGLGEAVGELRRALSTSSASAGCPRPRPPSTAWSRCSTCSPRSTTPTA